MLLRRSRRNYKSNKRKLRKRGRRWRNNSGFRKRTLRENKKRLRLPGLRLKSRNVKGLRRSKRLRKP